jgi:hypothetical protein
VLAIGHLGEQSSEWFERAEQLVDDAPAPVRLHAAAALVRHGQTSRLQEIVADATKSDDVRVRAEAIRVLGELDAEQNFAILRRAVLEDWEEFDHSFAPAAEEAALALARLSTPEALTALLQVSLVGAQAVWAAASDYFEALVTSEIQSDALAMPIVNWRKGRHWR